VGIKTLTVALGAALLTACAGTKFSFEQARQVKVGMSEAEVTERMGKPYMIKSQGDTQVWIWSHANGLTGGTQMISFEMKGGKVESVPVIPATFK
jgi:hypothetical protein